MIAPGEKVLSTPGADLSLVSEVQDEQESIQERIDAIDAQMEPLKIAHETSVERRNFWTSEMKRLSEALDRDHLVVYQYDQKSPWENGRPKVIDSRVIPYKTREAKKIAKDAIEKAKRLAILPQLRKERIAAKEFAARMGPFEEEKRALQAELDEWGQYYTDPDVYSKEYVRFARYWRDFLDSVDRGGRHYKPLSNIGANPPLIRYRRAKMRIIFRHSDNGIHVLRIARRGDDTYSSLRHLIDESDRYL